MAQKPSFGAEVFLDTAYAIGIIEALTADEHFQQAGFRALLREESP